MKQTMVLLAAALLMAAPAFSQSSVNLAWDFPTNEVSQISGFKVYASLTLTNGTLVKSVPATGGTANTTTGKTSFTTNVLRPGYGTYNFWVTAYNASIESGASNTVQQIFTISTPSGLTITSVVADAGRRDATIAWATSAPSSSKIYYGEGERLDRVGSFPDVLVTQHSVNLGGLKRHQAYSYLVESTDRAGVTARSPKKWFVTN